MITYLVVAWLLESVHNSVALPYELQDEMTPAPYPQTHKRSALVLVNKNIIAAYDGYSEPGHNGIVGFIAGVAPCLQRTRCSDR